MKKEEFNNLPNHFAERINGNNNPGVGVLQFGFKNGFNKAVELLGARVEHARSCSKMQTQQWEEAQAALNECENGPDKIAAQNEMNDKRNKCTCGLETIMKGYPQHG